MSLYFNILISMRQTLIEKVLTRVCVGDGYVKSGDIIMCRPDFIYLIELRFPQILRALKRWKVKKLLNHNKIILAWDHEVPIRAGSRILEARAAILKATHELGIKVYDIGNQGISHQLVIEKGYVLPGMFVVGEDSHASTCGAVGAVSIPLAHEISQVIL